MSVRGGSQADRVPDDFCLVTTYFNPAGYRTKQRRYLEFAARAAASGLPLFTVECAFAGNEFEIPSSGSVIRTRANSAMWQKERLLNLALDSIPSRYTKVVTTDFDLIFENPEWALETSRLLDEVPLVQPFDTVIWLSKGTSVDDGTGLELRGFASCHIADSSAVHLGDFAVHGVPGYAWGARRSLLERHGHYDACIIGGGDHLIAHAMCGDWSSACFDWSIGLESAHHRHFVRWAEPFFAEVRGRIGFVPGKVLHLWHGPWKKRRYTSRHAPLRSSAFDPDHDIRPGPEGCWEWSSSKNELHEAVRSYFAGREEDDDAA